MLGSCQLHLLRRPQLHTGYDCHLKICQRESKLHYELYTAPQDHVDVIGTDTWRPVATLAPNLWRSLNEGNLHWRFSESNDSSVSPHWASYKSLSIDQPARHANSLPTRQAGTTRTAHREEDKQRTVKQIQTIAEIETVRENYLKCWTIICRFLLAVGEQHERLLSDLT